MGGGEGAGGDNVIRAAIHTCRIWGTYAVDLLPASFRLTCSAHGLMLQVEAATTLTIFPFWVSGTHEQLYFVPLPSLYVNLLDISPWYIDFNQLQEFFVIMMSNVKCTIFMFLQSTPNLSETFVL